MAIQLKDKRLLQIYTLSKRAFGRYKWQIIILVVLGFVSGLLEGIGVNALIPMFSFMIGESQEANDFITRYIQAFFDLFNITFSLKYLLGFIVVLFILKAIVILIFNYVKIKIDTDFEQTTRNNLFKSTLNAKWPYLLKQKIGYLETVIMTDVLRGSLLLRQISNIIMVTTGIVMYTLVAFNISFTITLVTLALGGVFFLLFKPVMYRTRVYATRTSEANKEAAHFINENILGMKTIKSVQVAEKIVNRSKAYFSELKQLKTATFMLSTLSSTLLQPISLIFIVIVFAVAYKMPGFNLASLVAIIYLIQRMFQQIQSLQSNLHQMSESAPYLKNVLEYQHKADLEREQSSGNDNFVFNQNLTFNSVGFSYSENQDVLKGVSFEIKKGEMVGLIGASGSGKTTIVDLLLRLFTCGSGHIDLDGKDINKISLKDWRKNIGYVSQDIFLVNDTIANNIRFFDSSIAQDDIIKAAKMANIYEFIKKCPQGFNTEVGERGIMLSAGQRQRIAIARVLAQNPKLLILDEATSALDNESEAKIQEVIEKLHGKITVLVVAHRLSTVMNADKLIALEKGAIIEEGKPKDLLNKKKSYFYRLTNFRT